jgi:phosphatidylglycerophosphatase A
MGVVKESSDELNPPIAFDGALVAPSRPAHSVKDYLALVIATCGVGYLPLAPGTWGSLLAVGLYLLLRNGTVVLVSRIFHEQFSFYDPREFFVAVELAVIVIVSLVGTWAATQAEQLFGGKDPGKVVVDEVAGQLIALLPVPLMVGSRWGWWILVAFLLFRFFDIIKPYPARRLESLESGLGIMADDIVAGLYAAVVTAVLIALFVISS